RALAGPSTKPPPKLAPRRPIQRVRSAGAVTSAMYADATPMLAAKAPPGRRAAKSQGGEGAGPGGGRGAGVPAIVRSRTGRPPIRSDRRPQSGAHTNWAAAYAVSGNPIVVGLAPSSVAQNGSTGITIPNPIRSTITTLNRIQSGDRPGAAGGGEGGGPGRA